MPGSLRLFRKNKLLDLIPNAFAFNYLTGAALSTNYTSNTVQITGINAPVNFVCTDCLASVNGGPYSGVGTVKNKDTVAVQVTSSSTSNAVRVGALNIGGVIGTFQVTTRNYKLLDTLIAGSGTLNGLIATSGGSQIVALASAISVPTDGRWYFWSTRKLSGTAAIEHEYIYWNGSSYQYSAGGGSTASGIAIRYYSGRFYLAQINASGTGFIGSPTAITTAAQAVYAGIRIGASNSSFELLPDAPAPNIASWATSPHNVPTVSIGSVY